MKGNLLLGTAQGKLGDIVLSRKNGEQNARVRVRSIKNPKSDGQNVQRLIVTLISRAYSRMRSLADHSFQGFETGSPCQSRFNQLNMNLARQAAALEVAGQGTAEDYWNFIEKETYGLAYNPYYLATGSLANNLAVTTGGVEGSTDPSLLLNIDLRNQTLTYQDVCDLIGCQPGDQLTFAVMFGQHATAAGVAKGFTYGRVILWPSNGDMSSPFVNGSGEIQYPNARNEGKVKFYIDGDENCYVEVNGITPVALTTVVDDNKYGAMAVVISRLEGSTWLRSNSIFVVSKASATAGVGITDLYPSYGDGSNIAFSNPLYLNNAESNHVVTPPPSIVIVNVVDEDNEDVQIDSEGVYELTQGVFSVFARPVEVQPIFDATALDLSSVVLDDPSDHTYKYTFETAMDRDDVKEIKFGNTTIKVKRVF